MKYKASHFKSIKSHIFSGNKYRIIWKKPPLSPGEAESDRALGLCDPTDLENKTIHINPDQEGKELLKTAIDEAISACIFEIDNDFVDTMSESMGDFLWRMGFRLDKSK